MKLPIDSRALILRGVISVAIAAWVIGLPGVTILSLTLLLGIYLFFDGISALLASFHLRRDRRRWGASLFQGGLGVGAGFAAVVWPAITLFVLVAIVAAWALLTGVSEFYAALTMKWAKRSSRVLIGIAGVLSMGLGVVLISMPGLGGSTLIALVASYAVLFGLALISSGLQMRTLSREEEMELAADPEVRRAA